MALRRRRIKYVGNPWPGHWNVSQTWTVPDETKLPRGSNRELVSRQWEVSFRGHPNTWFIFDRYVYNSHTETEWVDVFATHPHAHFASFRPENIVNTRRHIKPKKKVTANAATVQQSSAD